MRILLLDAEKCLKCGKCAEVCPFGALIWKGELLFKSAVCAEECRACELACEEGAIELTECGGCGGGSCPGCGKCGGCGGG